MSSTTEGAGTGSGTGPGTSGPNVSGPGVTGSPASHGGGGRRGGSGSAWASGGTMFAGVLMLMNGIIGILEGIVGLASNDLYASVGDYVFEFNTTTWGWIHLILGILVAITGYGILKGTAWGKGVGVALAVVSVIAHFMWLPYQPLWGLIAIAIGVFVIWALCTDNSDRAA